MSDGSERALASQKRSKDGHVTDVNDAVLDELEAEESRSGYDHARLHYGELGSTCHRRDWFGLHLPRDLWDEEAPESIFRKQAGKLWEALVIRALRRSGHEIMTQVEMMPLRPSAWCFAPGHVDAISTNRRHLFEVKARDTKHFAKALNDPRKLVTEGHRFQASAYFHEAKARGLVDTASWIFVDRGGDHRMVEIQLTDDLLIPLEQIVAREAEKAYLVTATEAPERAPSTLALYVWKTKGRIEAHESRYSLCSFCKFQNACQPGPEDRLVDLESVPAGVRKAGIARAEAAWAAGSKTTPQVVPLVRDGSGALTLEAATDTTNDDEPDLKAALEASIAANKSKAERARGACSASPTQADPTPAASSSAAPPAPVVVQIEAVAEPARPVRSDHAVAMRRPVLPPENENPVSSALRTLGGSDEAW